MNDGDNGPGWQPMESAPGDRTLLIVTLAPGRRGLKHHEHSCPHLLLRTAGL